MQMANAVLLVFATLALVPSPCAGKKRGGVARESMEVDEEVSQGFAGAVDLGSAADADVSANAEAESIIKVLKESKASTATISERSPTKETSGPTEDLVPHKRNINYRREADKDVSQGYAGSEDVAAKDEELPAIVGQLPQSDEELPGLKDVELVEEIEECVLFFLIVVFFIFFGVCPALMKLRGDGKGGFDTMMEMASRFSIVQQALAVLGLTHHLNGMMAMQEQQQREVKSRRPQQTNASSNFRDERYVPSSTNSNEESSTFQPVHSAGGSNISSLLEEALADKATHFEDEYEDHSIEQSKQQTLPPVEENLLDSLGLIDTEEPLL